jgi:uracil-DNA glycosylase
MTTEMTAPLPWIEGLAPQWRSTLRDELNLPYFQELTDSLVRDRERGLSVFPDLHHVFRVFSETDLPQVRVVILGQDPYHGSGQAIGRAFAVPQSLAKKPPSLLNIFKEITGDPQARWSPEWDSELNSWVRSGVFLLNTILTVSEGQPLSHRNRGWERFTDRAIEILNERPEPIVFLLWGAPAQKKRALITAEHHVVLEASHPSPLSAYRGFLGCGHFARCNEILRQWGQPEVKWL